MPPAVAQEESIDLGPVQQATRSPDSIDLGPMPPATGRIPSSPAGSIDLGPASPTMPAARHARAEAWIAGGRKPITVGVPSVDSTNESPSILTNTLDELGSSIYHTGAATAASLGKSAEGLKAMVADAFPARHGGFIARGVSAPPKSLVSQETHQNIDKLAEQEAASRENIHNAPLELAAGAARTGGPAIVGSLAGPMGLAAGAGLIGLDTIGSAYADGNSPAQAVAKGALNAGASMIPGAGAGAPLWKKVALDAVLGATQDLSVQGVDLVAEGKPIDLAQTGNAALFTAGIGAPIHAIGAAGKARTSAEHPTIAPEPKSQPVEASPPPAADPGHDFATSGKAPTGHEYPRVLEGEAIDLGPISTGRLGEEPIKVASTPDFLPSPRDAAPGARPSAPEQSAEAIPHSVDARTVETPTRQRANGAESELSPATPPSAPAKDTAPIGKLDQLELWAQDQLKGIRQRKAEAVATLTPEQRRMKGSAEGPFDPNEAPYHAVILAAKVAKGAVKLAQWSREMVEQFGNSVKPHLATMWREGRKLSQMGDEERAAWYLSKTKTPETETPKQATMRSAGLSSPSAAVPQVKALQASLRAQARGAREGYRAGVADEKASQKNIAATASASSPQTIPMAKAIKGQMQASAAAETRGEKSGFKLGVASEKNRNLAAEQSAPQSIPLSRAIKGQMQASAAAETRGVKRGWSQAVEEGSGIRSELVRIIKETLPPGERDPMLGAVAGAQTLADMNRAVHRLRGVLANHEVREATARVERLTGKLKLDLPQRDSIRPELTEAEQAEALGKAKVAGIERRAMREIDINKIDPDYRDRIKPLIEQARSVKASLAGAKTIDEKYAAIHSFRKVFNDLREIVIQHEMEKTERVGRDKATVEHRRNQIIRKIESQPQIGQPDAAENQMPKNRGFVRRLIGQRGATPQSIVQDLDGTFAHDGPAGEVLLKAPREAENNKRGEVRRFNIERGDALKAAGYEPGTRKLSQFLNEREAVELPNAGKVNLTRSQQVGAYAWYSDPDFRDRVQTHGRARFNFQNDLTADPIQLTPADFEAIGQRLTPAERALKDTFFDGYNKAHLRDQSIKANFELKGSAPETHDGYYGGRINYEKTPSAGEPPSMRQAKRALENIGEMQDRIPGDHQYIFPDFIHDTDRFIDHTASLIHSAKTVRIARMILEHPQMKRALRNRYGPSIQGEIDRFILNLTESPTPPTADRGFMNTMNRQFSRAALALNPRTFVNNIVGGTSMIFPFFDAKDYAAGVTGMFNHGVHERMTKASNIAADRWENPLYEQYTPIAKAGETRPKLSISEGLKLAGKSAAGLKPREAFAAIDAAADSVTAMNIADSAPFRVAWAAAEHEVNRLHPDWTPEQKTEYTLDKFHDVVMRTQNGMTPTEISGLWSDARSSMLLKPMTFLRSDANKKLNLLLQARHADAATRTKILAALGMNVATSTASRMLVTGTAVGLAINLIYGNQPTEKQKSKLASNAGFKVLEDTVGLVPGGNYLTDLARAAYQGQDFDMSELPGVGIISDTVNTGVELARAFTSSDDTPNKAQQRGARIRMALYRLSNAIRSLAGDPTLPLTRDIVAAWDATEPPTSYASASARGDFKKAVDKGDPASGQILDKNRVGLPNLSRMIENAEPEEAVKLWAAGSQADQKMSRPAIEERIVNASKLTVEKKRELLAKVGLPVPPTLELESELTQLRKAKATAEAAVRDATALYRQAAAAERTGDASRAHSLRQQAGKLRREGQQAPADAARLQRFEQVQKSIANLRKQIDDGIVTKDAGEKRIANLVKLTQRKAA